MQSYILKACHQNKLQSTKRTQEFKKT